jgi:hypothetical protein
MKTPQQYWRNLQILNHKIIDFNTLKNKTEIDILDNLYDQGLSIETFKLNSKQYKRLFFNYYIKNIISFINKCDKKIFFIVSKPTSSEFFDYFDQDAILNSYQNNINKLFQLLPIKSYIDFNHSYDDILALKDCEINEWLCSEILTQSNKSSEKSYRPIKKISEYYDLQYIDNKIFRDLQYKSVF